MLHKERAFTEETITLCDYLVEYCEKKLLFMLELAYRLTSTNPLNFNLNSSAKNRNATHSMQNPNGIF